MTSFEDFGYHVIIASDPIDAHARVKLFKTTPAVRIRVRLFFKQRKKGICIRAAEEHVRLVSTQCKAKLLRRKN